MVILRGLASMTDVLHDRLSPPIDEEIAAREAQFEPQIVEFTQESLALPFDQSDRLERARIRRHQRLGLIASTEIHEEGNYLSEEQIETLKDNIGLAYKVVERFNPINAHEYEEFRQVAVIGLMKAVHRFNPELGPDIKFSTFAARTIEGELKKYLRDFSWRVHVPRGAKESYLKVVKALGDDRISEDDIPALQKATDLTEEDVRKGLDVRQARKIVNIDATSDDGKPIYQVASRNDPAEEVARNVTAETILNDIIQAKDPRLAEIIRLRMQKLSQDEIGKRVGLSQMQVGRLIKRAGVDYKKHLEAAS